MSKTMVSDIDMPDDGTDARMLFEITWPANFGPTWMNIDNLKALLFGTTSMTKERIGVRVLDNHEVQDANDKLNLLSKGNVLMHDLADTMEDILEDMDSWLTEHYNGDDSGVTNYIRAEYNKRLKESFRSCGWCGGNVFARSPHPGEPEFIVDHKNACPFRE